MHLIHGNARSRRRLLRRGRLVLLSAGLVSAGLVSAGLPSAGLLSAGLLSAGLLSAGLLSAGLLSKGLVSAGLLSTRLRSVGRVSAGLPWVGILWVGLLSYGPESSAQAAVPVAPATVERIAARGFPEWAVIDQRPFVREPRTVWTLYLEERTSGTVISGTRQTPIRETRVRIALERRNEGDEVDIGYVQHLSSTEIAVLAPGDQRLDEPPVVSTDPENPWPNPAGWSFVEARSNVDLDDDDANDLLLRYYATVADPVAQGIAALSADEFGTPRIMDLSEFVGTVNTEDLHLVDLEWPDARMFDPVLQATLLTARDCRFLAHLDIRGELQCDNCCSFPIYLRRAANDPEDRLFRPFFDREQQGGELLDRVRHDLALVSAGAESPEITSGEQAALARVASFFYLTGSGIQSRLNLEKALGERASDYKAQLLLDRIEDYFLRRN